MTLPRRIEFRLEQSGPGSGVRDYWMQRVRQHTGDFYLDISMSKFPEDLRVYEHLLWSMAADVVVELGCQFGGSTLWLRDRLDAMHRIRPGNTAPKVIAVDVDISRAEESLESLGPEGLRGIELIEGDLLSPAVVSAVTAAIPENARVMVVEDSAHDHETTLGALRAYSQLVPEGGFFVVEDGIVDIEWLRADDSWPRGVLPAIEQWLGEDSAQDFHRRRDLDAYGITGHPGGVLQRGGDPEPDATDEAVIDSLRELPMLSSAPWQMSFGERAALEGILAQVRPELAIEIGTAEGGSLSRVAHWSGEVHSFDLVKSALDFTRLPHVTAHTGDAHELLTPFLEELAASGRNVDFVLVDGDHSADGVACDVRNLLDSDAIRDTVIVLHDTANEEVRRGIDSVDYESYEKVRVYDLDAVPGAMAAVGDARGQLWGGLGLIVCATDNPVPHLPGPRIESWVSPTRLGLAGRALAGLDVERDTDFAALIPPPSAPAPSPEPPAVDPKLIPWRVVLRANLAVLRRAAAKLRARLHP